MCNITTKIKFNKNYQRGLFIKDVVLEDVFKYFLNG